MTLFFSAGTTSDLKASQQPPPPAILPPVCAAAWDDALFSSSVKPDEPGLAIFVRCGPHETIFRAFGLRDILRSKEPIDSTTNFRLASVSKQFTAMAIMLLVHDGKLRYDQTLASIWPDFPNYGKAITIRQLLNHTSGLPDYEELMEKTEKSRSQLWWPGKQIQDQEVLALLKAETRSKFVPGSRWAYSNSGYVLLGLIVAKVSAISFPDFLRARVFAPLQMDNTVAYVMGKNEVPNRAYGHTRTGNIFRETDQSPTSATLGDGGIYSNLLDLAKWDDALRNDALLTAKEMNPALIPAKLADGSQPHWPAEPGEGNLHPGKPVSYGFGWFLDPYELHGTHPRMYHTGTTIGFRTVIERYTEQPLSVIVLCNRTDLDAQKLAHQIADSYPPLK